MAYQFSCSDRNRTNCRSFTLLFFWSAQLRTGCGALFKNDPVIFLAGLCFALFHLAPSQGLGNISLIVSLFAFSCYLGFIYEKRGSLFASIGLHMTFNAVSTFRILFFPES